MLWYLPSVFKVISLWVTQPDQGAMMDLDAVTRSWNSPVQVTCTSSNEKKINFKRITPPTPPYSPRTTAGRHTSVCCDFKKKNQAFEITGFSFQEQRFGIRERYGSRAGFRWVCTKAGAMDRTVCNLFLFPKKPYCYCNITKTLMLYYDDLFYTT